MMKTLPIPAPVGRLPIAALLLVGMMLPAVNSATAQHGAEENASGTRPLKSIMVALAQDMNRISDGLWHSDFAMIRVGARAIADHPRVPPEEMAAIKEALENGFQQFVGFDKQVHDDAVELAEAARRHAMSEVLVTYRRIEQGCIACHAAFRDDVRAALYGRPISVGNPK